ncbi:MAG: hypothetical protein HQL34_04945 [Alphaproteobacteria bacterium]|nr:hypothetical protein [Alphaproteobacteria bacterium]
MSALSMEDVLAAINEMRREMQTQIAGLKSELNDVRVRQENLAATVSAVDSQALSPETLAIMAAVVTSHLGVKVRIRSARRVAEPSSTWAQRGRLDSHVSHRQTRTR